MKRIRQRRARILAAALLIAALGGCATTSHVENSPSEQVATTTPPPPPAPPPPQPPPVDLAGKWKLSAASGGACFMTLGATPGAAEGTVAPAGGCPGNFFTSRKWTFEHDKLMIRDYKGQVLAELSFTAGHFQGQAGSGGSITLTR